MRPGRADSYSEIQQSKCTWRLLLKPMSWSVPCMKVCARVSCSRCLSVAATAPQACHKEAALLLLEQAHGMLGGAHGDIMHESNQVRRPSPLSVHPAVMCLYWTESDGHF